MALYKLVCTHGPGKGQGVPEGVKTGSRDPRKREKPDVSSRGPLVVGVDTSTQSTKALVVDAATGRVVASGQAPHTVSSGTGRESDPRQWWDALGEALSQCGEAAREAAAVSVGGSSTVWSRWTPGASRCAPPCSGTTCAQLRRPAG